VVVLQPGAVVVEHRGCDPDHSALSRARNERFRDSDIFRRVLSM
jgi:hypothetical protein